MTPTVGRILAQSWVNLFRNAWIALATVFVFALALLSVNVLIGVQVMGERAVKILEEKIDMTVAFKPGTPEAVIAQARFYLSSLPQVAHAEIVGPDAVLAAFRLRHAQDSSILSGLKEVEGNPFGAQLIVRAKNVETYPLLIQAAQNPQYTSFIQSQSYDDHQTLIERIRAMGEQTRLFGSLLVTVFALFGALVAFNTIRIAIYTQREEISIMRLVGASSAYIRAPFMLEAVWLALASIVVAGGITYALALWAEPILQRSVFDGADPGIFGFLMTQGPALLLMQAVGLIVLATSVSWAAVGKYIRR